MNILKFALLAVTTCFVVVPCSAADTVTTTKEVQIKTGPTDAPTKEIRVTIDKDKKNDKDKDDADDEDDGDDDDFDDDEDDENPVGNYPYGQPDIKESSKGVWSASLPGKTFNIVSQWSQEPMFKVERNPDNKFEGAASLIAIKEGIPGQMGPEGATLLAYIYDPKALQIDTSSPAAVLKMFIDEPVAMAKQAGLTIKVDEPKGKQDKTAGVVDDTRRKLTLMQKIQKPKADAPESTETVEQVIQTHYYRILIGKDWVVLGLVMGDDKISEKDAQAFLDTIALKPKA